MSAGPKSGGLGRSFVLALPTAWLLLFLALPFLIVLKIAFAESEIGIPPYTPISSFDEEGRVSLTLYLANFELIVTDQLYFAAWFSSIRVAAVAAFLSLVLAYPMAIGIARAPDRWRITLLMLVMLPFWTSFLIRVYAWIGILKDNGWLNGFLLWAGVISEPLQILYTDTAMYIGLVYAYLPFAVLPLYATISKLDGALREAAADLGARPPWVFLTVTLPLSLPGAAAAFMLVFIPSVGEFVIPELLGGPDTAMVGKVLWTEFFQNRDWPLASALAAAMLLLLVLPIAWFQRSLGQAEQQR